MTEHCPGAIKATVSYSFNRGSQKKYFSKKPPIIIEVSETTTSGELQKFGTTATVPSNWQGAEVYLCGIVYTFPRYPNCPSEYQDRKIGTASAGQQLAIIFEAYPIGCNNAFFASVPAIGHGDGGTQLPGKSAQIGLKEIIKKCEIKITDSTGQLFKDNGKCPVVYDVACDDDCPSGHIRCKTSTYPGYCCIPCKPTAEKINNLANKIR
jgi:hypothetical protein